MEGGVPSGPIYSLDKVFNDPQVIDQGMVEQIQHPTIGALDLLANSMKMDAMEGKSVRLPPPLVGEHNEQVLKDYGSPAKKSRPWPTEGHWRRDGRKQMTYRGGCHCGAVPSN